MKITLDTNCIIDLEKNRPAAASLRALIDASRQGQVDLAVAAISASEKMQSGDYLTNFSEFEERLEQVGLSGARILEPMGIWGVTFWGYFLWSDDSLVGLFEEIHAILFRRHRGERDITTGRTSSKNADIEERKRTELDWSGAQRSKNIWEEHPFKLSMSDLVVKEPSPSLRDDFLLVFDLVAFADNPEWSDFTAGRIILGTRRRLRVVARVQS